jgi:quinoprotein glucose dehydrogenase
MNARIISSLGLTATLLACAVAIAAPNDEWTHYGGGQDGLQYSSHSQINRDNVDHLEAAWLFRTGELGQGHREPFAFQANPILVEGRLYFPTGSAIVFALNPASGEEIWRFDAKIDRSLHHAEIANRGVTSWIDETLTDGAPCRHRIFVGTLDARLIALDGESGKPCSNFGENGQLFLDRDVGADIDEWITYTVTSPPVIVDDVLVVSSDPSGLVYPWTAGGGWSHGCPTPR